MVRALLAGQKTQTRRVFSPYTQKLFRAAASLGECSSFMDEGKLHENDTPYVLDFCPYGAPGDCLWVKETFSAHGAFSDAGRKAYRADFPDGKEPHGLHWTPSIFCTRKASRITLEITAVRVERLNDISEADALAEGCAIDAGHVFKVRGAEHFGHRTAVGCFQTLWAMINGAGSWSVNPWVWVIEFKRV
jgi:hypothetical protein